MDVLAFGVANCYVATSEILAVYFDQRKYLAFPVAMLGYYVGMVAWPTASQQLLNAYGYQKSMGIMAAFHITHVVAGMLFYEPTSNHASEHTLQGAFKNIFFGSTRVAYKINIQHLTN